MLDPKGRCHPRGSWQCCAHCRRRPSWAGPWEKSNSTNKSPKPKIQQPLSRCLYNIYIYGDWYFFFDWYIKSWNVEVCIRSPYKTYLTLKHLNNLIFLFAAATWPPGSPHPLQGCGSCQWRLPTALSAVSLGHSGRQGISHGPSMTRSIQKQQVVLEEKMWHIFGYWWLVMIMKSKRGAIEF